MVNQDKEKLSRLLNSLNQLYEQKTINSDSLAVWWFTLKEFEWKDVSNAFADYTTGTNRMPKPSDIISLIRGRMLYRHPQLPKPKVDLVHAKEQLKKLKEKFGWKK